MLSFLFDVGMAIAPVTGYVMQYRLIVLNKSVGAFSTDVCLVLLFANITRLNFYLFRRYETALLFQSLFMIAAQLLLLSICTQHHRPSAPGPSEHRLVLETGPPHAEEEDFWRWSSFATYVRWIVGFGVSSLALSLAMKLLDVSAYGDLIGLVALLSESLLILPQIVQIFRQGRVGGISYHLIFLNLLGDIIKMYYFVLKDQPFQFKLCGAIQLLLDSFVVLQIFYYRRGEELTEEEESCEPQKEDRGTDSKDPEGSMTHSVVLEENLQEVDQGDSDSTRRPDEA